MKLVRSTLVASLSAVLLSGAAMSATAVAPHPTAPPPVPADYQPVMPPKVAVHSPQGVDNQRGIIKLARCSASLVKMSNSQLSDPALMLTNGHCMFGGSRFPKMGAVHVNEPVNLTGDILDDNSKAVMSIRGDKALYGTMTGTDAALVQLNVTFQQIKDKTGIDALPLANRGPKPGDALTVNSGYWKEIYRCPMVKQVYRLLEGSYTWWDSVKYRDACGIKPGTSGSPVIDDKTGEVVAVNNTKNESGGRCTDNNPCEQDEKGEIYYKKETNYGQQTQWFATCWTDARTIDLNKPGCKLARNGDTGPRPEPTPTPTPTASPTATPTPTSTPTPTPTATPTSTPTAPVGGEVAVTNSNVDEIIARSQKSPVVFVVGANWSGFTQKLLPKFRSKLAADGNTWTLAYVDGALYKQALAKFNIKSYPTVIAYAQGAEMTSPARFADGTRSQDGVDAFVEEAKRNFDGN